jgi:hypothetical protein
LGKLTNDIRKEKEKTQNEKKATTSDSSTATGEEDKEGDNFKSDAERQIEEAEIENAALEAAWQEKKIDLEYKLEFAQKDNEVIKGKVERYIPSVLLFFQLFHFLYLLAYDLLNRINDDIKAVQDELNQVREVHRGDMKEKTDTIKASEAELKKIELEIEKQQKELIAKSMSQIMTILMMINDNIDDDK